MYNGLLAKAGKSFLIMTIVCGVLYTAVVTGLGQLIFPKQANGSIIEAGGKKYGVTLLGQQFSDEQHMWGRIMNLDVSTFTDEEGNPLMYAGPSNISPASEDFAALVKERTEKLQAADPSLDPAAIPVDLVTCSGSGLDPHISKAAAEYQIPRLVEQTGKSEEEIRQMIDQSAQGRFLGLFGEETVNVLEFNLRLDGILTEK